METFKKITWLFLIATVLSCSNDDDDIEEVNKETFKIYSNTNSDLGLVLSGNDDEFVYEVYGEFKPTSNPDLFVPKNLKIVEQRIIGSNDFMVIKMNENFLPESFYKVGGGIKSDTIYIVVYEEDKTLINHNVLDEKGDYKTVLISEFSAVSSSANKPSIKEKQSGGNDEDCDPFKKEGEFDPCSDNHILKKAGDDWKNNSAYTIIKGVGKFISWIMSNMQEKLCKDKNSFKAQASKVGSEDTFSCEDYEQSEDIDDLCEVLFDCEVAQWYYNCYPVYDYWGYYLYDDCYWEYY